jgi:hypothetical protein
VIQQRSAEVTRLENGTEVRNVAIIHAGGVLFGKHARNIIHAEGVRSAFPSSAPKARMAPLITMARQSYRIGAMRASLSRRYWK